MAKTPGLKDVPARDIERSLLANGVRVWSERIPRASRCAVGVWIDAGSRYEELKESGATYLLQRLSMRGTRNRTADQIADAIDALGGKFDYDTERDYACWRALVDGSGMESALDLLADLALRPQIGSAAKSAEQASLLEELRDAEKEADLNLDRMFLRSLWKGHGLCRPPRGRLLTVKGKARLEDFKPKALSRFHERTHHPLALTITAAGAVNHEKFRETAGRLFGSLGEPKKTASTRPPTPYRFFALRSRPQFSGVRMQLGFPACQASDRQRHAAALLNSVIAGGAGSRLTRLFRNKGLAAADVSSSLLQFADAGVLSIRLRTSAKQAGEALDAVVGELRRLTLEAVDDQELRRAKATAKAGVLTRIDTPMARIEDLARQERYFGGPMDWPGEFAALAAVTANDLRRLASEWIGPHNLSLAVLGNLKGVMIRPKVLEW